MASVKVKNGSSLPFVDTFDGVDYVIEPGETASVPQEAAHLWLGNPNRDKTKEFKRTRRRKGAFYKQLDEMVMTGVDERKAHEKLKAAMAKMRGEKKEEPKTEATFSGFSEEEDVTDEDIGFLED